MTRQTQGQGAESLPLCLSVRQDNPKGKGFPVNHKKLIMSATAAALALAAVGPPGAFAAKQTPFGQHSKDVCPSVQGQVHCLAQVLTVAPGATAPAVTRATPFGYGPSDLRQPYGLGSASANLGAGQTIAIVDAYDDPNAASDLANYRSTYGLPG